MTQESAGALSLRWVGALAVGIGAFLTAGFIVSRIIKAIDPRLLQDVGDDQISCVAFSAVGFALTAGLRLGIAAYHRSWRGGMEMGVREFFGAVWFGFLVFAVTGGIVDYLFGGEGILHAIAATAAFLITLGLVRHVTEFGERQRRISEAANGPKNDGNAAVLGGGWGSAFRLRHIGEMYLNADVGERDELQALYWLQCAAKEGDIEAQISLANLLAFGHQVPRDPIQALVWLNKASKAGAGNVSPLKRKIMARLTDVEMMRLSDVLTARGALFVMGAKLLQRLRSAIWRH